MPLAHLLLKAGAPGVRKGTKLLLFALVTLIVIGSAPLAMAQVTLTVSSPTAGAAPGDFVTLVYSIQNTGATSATFQFELTLAEGLTSLGTPRPLTLSAGATDAIFITVLVSSRARAGPNSVTLAAISTSDPSVRASATATITVRGVPGIELTAPPDATGDPASSVPLAFRIVNKGNAPDRLALMASSRRGFVVTLSAPSVELLPAEAQTIVLTVSIPKNAQPGRDRITLEARSTVFPEEASATATANLTVLPPGPSSVDGTLFLEVPSQVSFSLQGQAPSAFTALTTLSGGADFEPKSRIDYRLQLANLLQVRQAFFEIDQPSFAVTLGDLALHWSDLVQLSGRGARLTARQGPLNAQVTVAAAQANALFNAGAQAALDPRPKTTLALQSLFGVQTGSPQFLGGISLDEAEFQFAQLFAELAFSHANLLNDQALLLRATSEIAGLIVSTEVVRAGSDFIGQRQDEAGLRVTQSFDASALRISSLFSRLHNDVNGDPARPTLTTTQAQAAARLAPGGLLPTVSAMIEHIREESTGPPPHTDLTQFDINFRLSERLGPLELSLFSAQARTTDQIAHNDLQEIRFGSDADLRIGALLSLFRVAQVSRFNLLTGALLNRSVEAFVSLTLLQPGRRLSFSVDRLSDATVLSGTINVDLGAFNVSSTDSLQMTNTGQFNLSLGIALALNFDLPIPFIPVKGRVEGHVFIDENGNGVRDAGEPGVPNLLLALDGSQARTDPQGSGLYRFFPLQPGRYLLRIANLPTELRALVTLPTAVDLKAGETKQIDIPLARVATIRGVVFNDANRNGTQDAGEGGVSGVRLVLTNAQSQASTQTSAGDGTFIFADLVPGDFTVSLDVTTLPERFEPTTAVQQTVSLKAGQTVKATFGAGEKPQKIKFSPTADFSFTPENPTVGQVVRFDGSASFDPDGQIVKYEWDFQSDGTFDATGPIVEFAFAAAGTFNVTLRVTDNDGNTGSKTKSIKISQP